MKHHRQRNRLLFTKSELNIHWVFHLKSFQPLSQVSDWAHSLIIVSWLIGLLLIFYLTQSMLLNWALWEVEFYFKNSFSQLFLLSSPGDDDDECESETMEKKRRGRAKAFSFKGFLVFAAAKIYSFSLLIRPHSQQKLCTCALKANKTACGWDSPHPHIVYLMLEKWVLRSEVINTFIFSLESSW